MMTRKHRTIVRLFFGLLLTACGSSDKNETESTSTVDGTAGSATEGTGDPGGPEVNELLSDNTSLAPTSSVTITALVSDPDGLEDIVGGVLTSPDGSAFYGAFTQVSGGTFKVVIGWDVVHSALPIEFTTDNSREFIAEFSDNSGKKGTRGVTINLDCGGLGACNGECTDLFTDDNCGDCGEKCGSNASCVGGMCQGGQAKLSQCFGFGGELGSLCSTYCEDSGKTCGDELCDGASHVVYESAEDCAAKANGTPSTFCEVDCPEGWDDQTTGDGEYCLGPQFRCCCV